VIYPEVRGKPRGYAYWHGVQVLRDEHKALCRSAWGKTVIFCGDPGSGKSTAVNSIVHGESGLQPDRSLTLRCFTLNRKGMTDEEKITRIQKILHLGQEDDMSAEDVASFMVEAVVKKLKRNQSPL
jgi:septin family protein